MEQTSASAHNTNSSSQKRRRISGQDDDHKNEVILFSDFILYKINEKSFLSCECGYPVNIYVLCGF